MLFIDARKMGVMVDRTRRELTDEEIQRIADTYHAWRTVDPHPACGHPLPEGEGNLPSGRGAAMEDAKTRLDEGNLPSPSGRGAGGEGGYRDIPGFCKSATLEEIRQHGYVLTPGRYVGAAEQEDDGEPFAEKMAQLAAQWREQREQAARLDAVIEANLKALGF